MKPTSTKPTRRSREALPREQRLAALTRLAKTAGRGIAGA
jgi:hypothetical protein